jgi:tetraacyldisaccharide 4'-kinase
MKTWRYVLAPLSIVYGIITYLRNLFYAVGLFKTNVLVGKSITIGNLNAGGSGKSPLTLYLMRHLQHSFTIQVLSRGYGRKTRGHIALSHQHQAEEVGDEPLLYKQWARAQDEVHVAENRFTAIQTMNRSKDHVLLLDDAFQHRSVKAGLSIVVSAYDYPFFSDFLLPFGNLRELRSGVKRADIVLYTKCPETLTSENTRVHREKVEKYGIPCFFSRITYPALVAMGSLENVFPTHAMVVTAIANPTPLYQYLAKQYEIIPIPFSDHHAFTPQEIKEIHKKFDTFDPLKTIIITTEKDHMRLKSPGILEHTALYPWYVQPMSLAIEHEEAFLTLIENYVSKN